VIRTLLLTFVLGLPLYLALSTASCGPTCGNLKGCTTGSTGDAGDTSTSTSSTCAALTARQACLSSFCQGSDAPYCGCLKQGQELNVACKCVTPTTADAAAYCESAAAQGIDDSNFDCSAQTGAVATLCVPVQ